MLSIWYHHLAHADTEIHTHFDIFLTIPKITNILISPQIAILRLSPTCPPLHNSSTAF